jgi:hypothetical protein
MLIRKPTPRKLGLDEPILHRDSHKRPLTRRDFIAQGMQRGGIALAGASVFSLFANPRAVRAALSPDLNALKSACGFAVQGAGKIPFIAFDLAGGANLVGSEVLVGGQGGQLDFISTAGYAKVGLPGDMVPNAPNPQSPTNNFVSSALGLAWHSDGALLRGILSKVTPATAALINGAVIPARSENDTGNNPHNPMYGIYRAGADGSLLSLIGSRASDSGGNSMAPMSMYDPAATPTKVDRTSDVTGLVDTGKLVGLLDQSDAVAVMEAIQRISDQKLANTQPKTVTRDEVVRELVRCNYVKAADLTDRFGNPSSLNPELDPFILEGAPGATAPIFTRAQFDGDAEFRKTAAVMKLVLEGYAGAGTITMGGYDYHGQGRATGEVRNFRAGQCMGACLEYAARKGVPLMLYVFSDGGISAGGQVDSTVDGRGKFMWTSDNQSTASTFFLVFNPAGRPALFSGDSVPAARHQQLGYFRADASVETTATPGANAVNLLVEMVVLNYMALHGQQSLFGTANFFPNHGLGSASLRDSLTAFNPIVNGTIT